MSVKFLDSYFLDKIYLPSYTHTAPADVAPVREELFASLRRGPSITLFFGHGAPNTLTRWGAIFDRDRDSLLGDTIPTIWMSFACLNADFREPYD